MVTFLPFFANGVCSSRRTSDWNSLPFNARQV